MSIQYYQPDENGKILSVMHFENEEDVNDWVKGNCIPTNRSIVQTFDGSYQFESEVDWQAEQQKKLQAQYEQLKTHFTAVVQVYMDKKAQEKGYDDIAKCVTYEGDDDPVFNEEGTKAKKWRSAVWRKCYSILDEVTEGKRPVPTEAELIAELPVLNW